MNEESEHEALLQEVRQQTLHYAHSTETGELLEEAFTRWGMELLEERGEAGGGEICSISIPKIGKVNGYWHDHEGAQLVIYVSLYSGLLSVERLSASRVTQLVEGVRRLVERCKALWHRKLEESSDAFEFGELIASLDLPALDIRIVIFTDALCPRLPDLRVEICDCEVKVSIWDLARFGRAISTENREEIVINLRHDLSTGLPFLRAERSNEVYDTYVAMVPGNVLFEIYREHGSRLLEKNVRSFLQARGKVNKGIRETIIKEPEMFLAYNNGLCATAAAISITEEQGPLVYVNSIRDFQIVNGGQTTASLHCAAVKDKKESQVSQITVQLKLSVIKDTDREEEIVGHIARYANSQNKVSEADLKSNETFHRAIEALSRATWAPARDGSLETKWFYERARGQYVDEKVRRRTPAQIKAFEREYPRTQLFTKTDLAKFENTWEMFPHLVSRGAQKNFTEFNILFATNKKTMVADSDYFKELVAKAILFHTAEKIVSAQSFGGYRANIVTYTLAWIFHHTARKVDLAQIWIDQAVSSELCDLIRDASFGVHNIITDTNGRNVTEFCKKEECWNRVSQSTLALPERWVGRLAQWREGQSVSKRVESLSKEDESLIAMVAQSSAETWFSLAKWAAETGSLEGWQRKIAYSLGKLKATGRLPTIKQAVQGQRILDEAHRLGFRPHPSE